MLFPTAECIVCSKVRDRTNKKHCPSHKIWSYKRDMVVGEGVVRQGFYCIAVRLTSMVHFTN